MNFELLIPNYDDRIVLCVLFALFKNLGGNLWLVLESTLLIFYSLGEVLKVGRHNVVCVYIYYKINSHCRHATKILAQFDY